MALKSLDGSQKLIAGTVEVNLNYTVLTVAETLCYMCWGRQVIEGMCG